MRQAYPSFAQPLQTVMAGGVGLTEGAFQLIALGPVRCHGERKQEHPANPGRAVIMRRIELPRVQPKIVRPLSGERLASRKVLIVRTHNAPNGNLLSGRNQYQAMANGMPVRLACAHSA